MDFKDLLTLLVAIISTIIAIFSYKTSKTVSKIERFRFRKEIIKPCQNYLLNARMFCSFYLKCESMDLGNNVVKNKKYNEEKVSLLKELNSFNFDGLPREVQNSYFYLPKNVVKLIDWLNDDMRNFYWSHAFNFDISEQERLNEANIIIYEKQDATKIIYDVVLIDKIQDELIKWCDK